jgi:putative Holliday junction resolvase
MRESYNSNDLQSVSDNKTIEKYNKKANCTTETIVNDKGDLIIMGLDISPRYCGVSITDSKRIATKSLFTITWNKRRLRKFLHHLYEIANLYKVGAFVIGLPVNVYEVLPQSKSYITTLAHNLKKITNLPYFFQNEHLSTVMSTAYLRGTMPEKKIRQRQNEVAASYILQSFLEENRSFIN